MLDSIADGRAFLTIKLLTTHQKLTRASTYGVCAGIVIGIVAGCGGAGLVMWLALRARHRARSKGRPADQVTPSSAPLAHHQCSPSAPDAEMALDACSWMFLHCQQLVMLLLL